MRGIELLKERGLPLSLKTVAVTINQHEIGDMQRFAEDELGVPFKFDGMINARIDCSHSPLDVRLSPADMVRLDFENPARRDAWAQLADAGAKRGRSRTTRRKRRQTRSTTAAAASARSRSAPRAR